MKNKGKITNNNKKNLKTDPKSYRPNSSRNAKKYNINNVINIKKFQLSKDNINAELKDIKKILIENQNKKEKKEKILIKNTNISISKENLILSLRKELNFQKLLKIKLLSYKEYADNNSNSYKTNYENICKYKEQLHLDMGDFLNLVDNYEKLKDEYSKEKEMIIKTNDNLIKYKKEEQNKLKSTLDKLNYDTQNQQNTIQRLGNTISEYKEKNDEYFRKLENNEAAHDEKYEMLLNEFKRLENEYEYYFDLELKSRKNNLDRMNKNLCAEEEGLAVLRLSDKQVKSQYLKKIINNIQSQIHEIEKLNKRMEEDREIAKLLGKRGAEKFRERMSEKYKSEISTINTKFNFTVTSY